MKTIVLITTGQPASNPRLVKEAMVLVGNGYRVKVLYCFWTGWARMFDERIKKQHPQIEWHEVGGNPDTAAALYLFTRLRHKFFRLLYRRFPHSLFLSIGAELRGFPELLKKAKRIKADLYIAHNLGALPVAAKAAAWNRSKFAFDAEDFHRGQVPEGSGDLFRIKNLEDSFLKEANYLTAASPLIALQYQKLYGKATTVINNVFPAPKKSVPGGRISKKITLFWFSQTIGTGRGLEDVFLALKMLPIKSFSLKLLGQLSADMRFYFDCLATNEDQSKIDVMYVNPVHPDEIVEIAASCDIGLALEPGKDTNNQLALSNKIFTYLTAGNAIIFSSTPAQERFYKENPSIGEIYKAGNAVDLAAILKKYNDDAGLLVKQKEASGRLALEKYNWESEQVKFLSLVRSVLN